MHFKKRYVYILIFLNILFCIDSIAQTIYKLDATNNGTTVNFSCPISNTRFSDDGDGTTHYSNNIDYRITFCAPTNKLLKFDFGCGTNSTIERIHPSDTLFIYDGNSTSSPLLYKITGNSSNSNRLPYFGETSSAIFTSPNSCITFRLKSGSTNNEDGWDACVTCVDPISCGTGNAPASDLFMGATSVCNLSNYCGQTSGNFGSDFPVNLNPSGGSCPSGLNFLGTIENNSWLKFQAVETSASFIFNVPLSGGCINGIQTAIFSYNGTNLTRLTPCANSDGSWAGTFTLSTNSPLVPGNEYFLMIDGNAGDVCNYSITANTGASVVNAGIDKSVCTASTNLSANLTVGTGTWSVLNGSGIFTNPNSHTTTVTGLNAGINTFRWTVNTSNCGIIYDDVIIDAGCLLPIELNKFDYKCDNDHITIEWETLIEVNNKEFILEKSYDGETFTKIYSVQGKENSQEKNHYQYKDYNIKHNNIYYQLKQIDLDGSIFKSNIITTENICTIFNSYELNIYPNPAKESLFIDFKCEENSTLTYNIIDQYGQYILNSDLFNSNYEPGEYKIKIDINLLAAGFYYIKIRLNEEYRILKLIIE